MTAQADDELWSAIADPSRRRVLDLLVSNGEVSASWLAGRVPFSRQAVSKHLVVLEQAGLVSRRKQGREVLYQVEADRLDQATRAMAELAAQWDRRLAAIKQLAEAAHARSQEESESPKPPEREESVMLPDQDDSTWNRDDIRASVCRMAARRQIGHRRHDRSRSHVTLAVTLSGRPSGWAAICGVVGSPGYTRDGHGGSNPARFAGVVRCRVGTDDGGDDASRRPAAVSRYARATARLRGVPAFLGLYLAVWAAVGMAVYVAGPAARHCGRRGRDHRRRAV